MVATVFAVFALVATYVPQDWNRVEVAHAGSGYASEFTQMLNNFELLGINISDAVTAAKTTITAWSTTSLWLKENVLDGIAWAIAKSFIASMVQSLISWINSGFKGSPMFIQDLEGFLRNAADQAFGQYLDEIGGVGSFICDPFKLDIQIALAIEYEKIRDNGMPSHLSKCTLTGVIDNIEDFMSGVEGSFSKGGWDDWFDITSKPDEYTPFGAALAAERLADVRVLNTRIEENTVLDWGAGFLSGEICNMIAGPNGTSKESCSITKPGKIIQETLNSYLDSGRQSLVAADEMNEIIAALLGQLANSALQGASGLLGLSGGTGYTYSGFSAGSYLGQMTELQTSVVTADGLTTLTAAKKTQDDYASSASTYRTLLLSYAADSSNTKVSRDAATAAAADAATIIANATSYSADIATLIVEYKAAVTSSEKAIVLSEFNSIPIYSEVQLQNSESAWKDILNN